MKFSVEEKKQAWDWLKAHAEKEDDQLASIATIEWTQLVEYERNAQAWIKASPHRSSCASYGLPDKYQGQQHPCTCGRNALLGL
jgi:hypothetical protein